MNQICTRYLAAAVVAAFFGLTLRADGPPLAHMVFFELEDSSAKNQKKLVAACQKYLSKHDGTLHFSAGVLAKELDRDVNDRGFDVSLHLIFKDKAAHDKYQTNPRHLQFIKENKHLWKSVRVFDSYLQTPVATTSEGSAGKGFSGVGSATAPAPKIKKQK